MPNLGIGSSLTSVGVITPGVVTDNLVLKHKYSAGGVVPVSDGAADINADAAANEYVDVGTIEITTNDVSMSALVYVTAHVDNAAIIVNRHASGDNQGIGLRVDSGNQRFEVIIDEATSGARDDGDDLYNLNQWYHVCGVWDRDDKQYLYVNGVLNDSGDITAYQDSLTHTTNVFIGKNQASAEFRGYICNIGYWNEALTQAQIKSIMWKNYAGLTSSETTNLVSWWNLDTETNTSGEAGTGGVKDSHGTNHGTLT